MIWTSSATCAIRIVGVERLEVGVEEAERRCRGT